MSVSVDMPHLGNNCEIFDYVMGLTRASKSVACSGIPVPLLVKLNTVE